MASVSPDFSVSLAEFAAVLLSEREVKARCRRAAEYLCLLAENTAVCVYTIRNPEEPIWQAEALAGEMDLEQSKFEVATGTLGAVAEQQTPLIFGSGDLSRDDYPHLRLKHSFLSLAYYPVGLEEELIGAIEVVSFKTAMTEEELGAFEEYAEVLAIGLKAAFAYEEERTGHLEALNRITKLYDLEATFNALLEIGDLMPVVTTKAQELFECQTVNLWLVEDDDKLVLMQQTGEDGAFEVSAEINSGEGAAGRASETGEPVLIDSAEDEILVARNANVSEGQAFSVLAAPLIERDVQVGVLELVNKLDGTPFDETDQFLLENVAGVAAGALHNASLLDSERKVEILETLVKVSAEITSTLNIDRVMQSIVNGPQSVIPYERASIGLEHHGKFQLRAISGMNEVPKGDSGVNRLGELLEWVSSIGDEMYINRTEEGIDDEREETRAKFAEYFDATGYNGFYGLPLVDDQGPVGVLCMESSQAGFLEPAHLEIIKVLSAQATVALRNAQLFREVPLIGVLEPLIQKKRQFFALPERRQKTLLFLAAAAAVFFAVFPWPMRVDGNARVTPGHVAEVPPQVEGAVTNVYVREGDPVTVGTILAQMDDTAARSRLAAAQAKLAEAQSAMSRALSTNDVTTAGVQRIYTDYWTSEVQLARQQVEHAKIKAPISGVVTTPHIEDSVGKHLAASDTFAEISDVSTAQVDVAIEESDAALLQSGEKSSVKLLAYPSRTFSGTVYIVSPRAETSGDGRVVYARVDVPNEDGSLKPGMQGRAKVLVGWHRAGYVFFRRPAMWMAEKFWSWFGA